MRVCPKAAPPASWPRTVITVGSLTSVSAGMPITVPSSNDANALALTRSAGMNAVPKRASPRCGRSTETPGAASTSTVTFPASSG